MYTLYMYGKMPAVKRLARDERKTEAQVDGVIFIGSHTIGEVSCR